MSAIECLLIAEKITAKKVPGKGRPTTYYSLKDPCT